MFLEEELLGRLNEMIYSALQGPKDINSAQQMAAWISLEEILGSGCPWVSVKKKLKHLYVAKKELSRVSQQGHYSLALLTDSPSSWKCPVPQSGESFLL